MDREERPAGGGAEAPEGFALPGDPPPPGGEGGASPAGGEVLASLERVRWSVLLYGVAFLAASSASWPLAKRAMGLMAALAGRPLVAYSPSEPLMALLSLSTGLGLALSFPLLAHLGFRLLSSRFPGAFPRRGVLVVPAATLLFLAGAAVAWFLLLPAGVGFLVAFESADAKALLSIRSFVSFCTTFLVALGAAFEAPLVALLLARAGILTPALFRKSWRPAIVGCVVLSAFLTPTPDAYNMGLMAVPLLGLYGTSYLLVVLFGKKRGGGGADGAGGEGPREEGG